MAFSRFSATSSGSGSNMNGLSQGTSSSAGAQAPSSPLRTALNIALRRTTSSQEHRRSLSRQRSAGDIPHPESARSSGNEAEPAERRDGPIEPSELVIPPTSPVEPNEEPCLRIVPHLESIRSLHFEPVERKLKSLTPVRIGRFTDKAANTDRITFKSKVVSRAHAEVWSENEQVFIKDIASSSGTFLNHLRLSPPGKESRAYQLKDGDVVQLGVDYQGGTEEIYRCVKMRIELNRSWQRAANAFSTTAIQNLKQLNRARFPNKVTANPTNEEMLSITDCCICLFSIAPNQALFVAPCSHTYHYKCIRPLLTDHFPGFLCPLCRAFADLEANVEVDSGWEELLNKGDANVMTPQSEMESNPFPAVGMDAGADNFSEAGNVAPSRISPRLPGTSASEPIAIPQQTSSNGQNVRSTSPIWTNTPVNTTVFALASKPVPPVLEDSEEPDGVRKQVGHMPSPSTPAQHEPVQDGESSQDFEGLEAPSGSRIAEPSHSNNVQ